MEHQFPEVPHDENLFFDPILTDQGTAYVPQNGHNQFHHDNAGHFQSPNAASQPQNMDFGYHDPSQTIQASEVGQNEMEHNNHSAPPHNAANTMMAYETGSNRPDAQYPQQEMNYFESPQNSREKSWEEAYALAEPVADGQGQIPPNKKRKQDEYEEADLTEMGLMRVEEAIDVIASRNISLKKQSDGTYLVLNGPKFEKEFETLRVTREKKNVNAKHRPFASMSRHFKLLRGEKWAGTGSVFAPKNWKNRTPSAPSPVQKTPSAASAATPESPDDGIGSPPFLKGMEAFAATDNPPEIVDNTGAWAAPSAPPMSPPMSDGIVPAVSADRVQVHLRDAQGTVLDCTLQHFLDVTGAGELYRKATGDGPAMNGQMQFPFANRPGMLLKHDQLHQVVGGLWNADSRGDQAYFFKREEGVEPFTNGSIVGVMDGKLVGDDVVNQRAGLFMVVSDNNAKWKGEPIPTEEEEAFGHWCAFLGQVPVIVDGPVVCGEAIGPKFDGSGHGKVTKLGESPVVGIALDSKQTNRPGIVKTLIFAGLNAMTGSKSTNDQYDNLLQQSLKADVAVLQHEVAAIESGLEDMQGRMDEQFGHMIQFQDRVRALEKNRQLAADTDSGDSGDTAGTPAPAPAIPAATPQGEVQIGIPMTAQPFTPVAPVKEGSSKNFKIMVVIALCVILLGIGITLGVVLSKRGGSDSNSTPSGGSGSPSTPTPAVDECGLVGIGFNPSQDVCPTNPFSALSNECQNKLNTAGCDMRCSFCSDFHEGPNTHECKQHIGEADICDYEQIYYNFLEVGLTTSEDYWCEWSSYESDNYPGNPCMEEVGFYVEQAMRSTPVAMCPYFGGPPTMKCPSEPWDQIDESCKLQYECADECIYCGDVFGGPVSWNCLTEPDEAFPCENEQNFIEEEGMQYGYYACAVEDSETWPCEQEMQNPEAFGGYYAFGYYQYSDRSAPTEEPFVKKRIEDLRQKGVDGPETRLVSMVKSEWWTARR